MATENKLFLIGVKCSLPQLAKCVGLVDSFSSNQQIAYFDFWEKICFIVYDRDSKEYTVKENCDCAAHYHTFNDEIKLFQYMDENDIQFVGDENPLGAIFSSYSAAYLEVVRWAADICYICNLYNDLLEG